HVTEGRPAGSTGRKTHPERRVRDEGKVVVDARPPGVEVAPVLADGQVQHVGSAVGVRGAVDDAGRGRRGRGRGGRAIGRALLDAPPAAPHPRLEARGAACEDDRVVLAEVPAWPAALPERAGAAAKLLAAGVDADAAVVAQLEASLAAFVAAGDSGETVPRLTFPTAGPEGRVGRGDPAATPADGIGR